MQKLAAKKRTGRPPRVARQPDDMRHIPLDLRQADVEALDREAAELGISRAELCRRRLRAPARVFSEREGGFVDEADL